MDPSDLHSAIAEQLQGVSQRYTRGRKLLVDVLARSGRPLTIPEIVGIDPTLPQSSIYRNLSTLEEAGAVRRLPGTDEFARYELAEDLTHHHHHLVCSSCGGVTDFMPPTNLETTLEKVQRTIEATTGFKPDAHSLDFVGVCGGCLSR